MAKHERLSVAMVLAEQLHHSVNRVERDEALRRQTTRAYEGKVREVHHALRGQTLRPRGQTPQVRAATFGYVAAAVPFLAQPVLGGGDSLDVTAVQFLLAQSLLQCQREEGEAAQLRAKEAEEAKEKKERKAKYGEKMLAINRRVRDDPATPAEEAAWRHWMGLVRGGSSSSSSVKRKKKKRRRRVTSSSRVA